MGNELESLKGLLIAHRGLFDNEKGIPENSMIAFAKALEKNFSIELDLHILKDNTVIVFHDDNLKRITGYDKPVRDCTYSDIKDLRLLNTNERIPILEEVLSFINGSVLLDIEFKYDTRIGRLEEHSCKLLDKYSGNFIVNSFNPLSVKWFKDNRPKFIRGQISSNFVNNSMNWFLRYILKNMYLNVITKPNFISYDINSITKNITEKYKRKSIPVFLWTITSLKELKSAKELGNSYIFQNIFT